MRSLPVHIGRGLAVVWGVALAASAHGQADSAPPPGRPAASVHRLVILEGPNRRVHYVTSGAVSAADRAAAYDLERAENELTYLHDLQRLKHQYVASERVLEPQRRYVQEQLYGTQIRYGGSGLSYTGVRYPDMSYYPWGYGAYGGLGYGGWGFGGGGYGVSAGAVGSGSYSVVRSLQYGMGNEGVLKNALVQAIARDASADAAAARRAYDAAVARAADSPVLARDLGLQKTAAPSAPREPTFNKGGKVTVWVGNDKYTGTVKEDRPGWVVLQTDKGEVTVRKSEITRSETEKKP